MEEKQLELLLVCICVALLISILFGHYVYAFSIIFMPRFHKVKYMLTLNVCVTTIICTSYWTLFFLFASFMPDALWTPNNCLFVIYGQAVVNCLVTYAFCAVSLNRLITIVYGQTAFLRKKKGIVLCMGVAWMFAIVLPLPTFGSNLQHCLRTGLELGYQIYTLVIIVTLPTIVLLAVNTIIAILTTRPHRVHPENRASLTTTNRRRDSYLLKHMFVMFSIFVGGWMPIYIVAVINWNDMIVPHTIQRMLTVLPILSLFGDLINLFWYNRELRKCLCQKLRIRRRI